MLHDDLSNPWVVRLNGNHVYFGTALGHSLAS